MPPSFYCQRALLPLRSRPQVFVLTIGMFGLPLLYCEQCCLAHSYAGFGVRVDSLLLGVDLGVELLGHMVMWNCWPHKPNRTSTAGLPAFCAPEPVWQPGALTQLDSLECSLLCESWALKPAGAPVSPTIRKGSTDSQPLRCEAGNT